MIDKALVEKATKEIAAKEFFDEIVRNIGKQDIDSAWFSKACMGAVGGPEGMTDLIKNLLESDSDSIRVRVLQVLAKNAEKQADRTFEARMEVGKKVMAQDAWKQRFKAMVESQITKRQSAEGPTEEDACVQVTHEH